MATHLERLLVLPPAGAYQTQSLIVEDGVRRLYRSPPDNESFYPQDDLQRVVFASEKSLNSSAVEGERIIKKFEMARDRYERNEVIAKTAFDTVNAFVLGSFVFAGPVVGGVAGIIWATGTMLLREEMLGNCCKAAKEKLAIDLAEHRTRNQGRLDSLMVGDGTTKGKERFEKIYDREHPVLNSSFENVPDEAKALVHGKLIQMLADADKVLFDNDQRLWDKLADLGDELHADKGMLEENLVKNNLAFLQFRNNTIDQMAAFTDKIEEINTGLEETRARVSINEQRIEENRRLIKENRNDIEDNKRRTAENSVLIEKNSKDIGYLQGYLFGKMDPEEQLAALESGFYSNMSGEERADLISKIEHTKKRKELMDTMQTYLNGGQDMLAIANNLGIDVPKGVSMAVSAGSAIFNATAAFASGNYLGAIASLTSLAGLGKKTVDVGAERHTQVMTALSQLAQGQDKILEGQDKLLTWAALSDQKLDQVFESQKALFDAMIVLDEKLNQIIDNQERLYNGLVQISKQLEEHHRKMMIELANIVDRLVVIRFEIRASNLGDVVANCRTSLEIMLTYPGYIRNENRFQSYSDVLGYYRSARHFINPGLKELLPKTVAPGSFTDSNFYQLGEIEVDINKREKDKTSDHYDKLRDLVFEFINNIEEQELCLTSLINPVNSIEGFEQKLRVLRSARNEDRLPTRLQAFLHSPPELPQVSVRQLLAKLYSTDFVLEFTEYSRRFHYLWQFYTGEIGSKFYPSIEALTQEETLSETSKTGKCLLEKAMVRLDIAIAQQSLMSGDYLLPAMDGLYSETRTETNQENYDSLVKRLEENYLLATNFITYAFYKKARDKMIDYTLAYFCEKSDPLKNLLGGHWNFQWNSERRQWFVQIGEHGLEIPRPKQLQKNELLVGSEMQKLLDQRKKLAVEYVSYNFAQEQITTPIGRETYVRALALRV